MSTIQQARHLSRPEHIRCVSRYVSDLRWHIQSGSVSTAVPISVLSEPCPTRRSVSVDSTPIYDNLPALTQFCKGTRSVAVGTTPHRIADRRNSNVVARSCRCVETRVDHKQSVEAVRAVAPNASTFLNVASDAPATLPRRC